MPDSVSIIVPIYIVDEDVLNFSRECIEELRGTLKDGDEVIVLDDCSPMKHDIKTDYYNEVNRGLASLWNQGIRMAKNDIVLLANSDTSQHDWWPMIKSLDEYDIVFPKVMNMANLQLEERLAGEFFMFRKSLIDEIGYFREDFWMSYEDTDFFMRALEAGKRLGVCSYAKIIHLSQGTRKRANDSQTRKERERKAADIYKSIHGSKHPKLSYIWDKIKDWDWITPEELH
jgi:GT2 family glycosyltransferase